MAILIMAGREVLCFIVNMGGLVVSELVMMGTDGSGVDISGEFISSDGRNKVRSKSLFIPVSFVEATVSIPKSQDVEAHARFVS